MSVKAGVIGLGGMGFSHLARLAEIKDVELKAACDVVGEKAANAAKQYGISAYIDYRMMLDKEKLDTVFVCVAPFGHGDIEVDLAEMGLPFLVEKPVNLSLEKAREVNEIVRKKKLITSVGYCLRYMDIVEMCRKLMKGKKVAQVLGRYFGQVPAEGKGWYSQKARSGGQVVEQATHIVDLMRYLAGEIDTVYARGFRGLNRYENYDVEDASIVTFNFKSGAIGSLSCNWLLWGYQPSLELVTGGTLIKYSLTSLEVQDKDKKEEFFARNNFTLLQDEIFIEAVKKNDPSRIKSDYNDGLKTLEATIAANKSMETGEVIKL